MRLFVPLLIVCAACNEPGVIKVRLGKKSEPGKTAASFGDEKLTDKDLEKQFALMNPVARARFQTLEQKHEFVEGMVRYEVLAREAVKRGMAEDPEALEAWKRVMVQKLIRQEIDEKPVKVSDAEIAAYYEKRKSDFVKPSMTRLSHVFVKKPNKAKAEEALEKAKKMTPLDYASFGTLARETSEEQRTAPIEGDMRFLSDEELSTQYGPELVEPAKSLTQVGQVYDTLIETKDGWHVLKLQGRQVALNLSLEQVKQSIESTLSNESRQARYRQFLKSTMDSANVKIDDAVLAQVQVDLKTPGPKDPVAPPGYVPPPPPEGNAR